MRDLEAIESMTQALAQETEGISLPAAVLNRGVRAMLSGTARLQPKYWVASDATGGCIGFVGVSPEHSDWWDTQYWWIVSIYVKESERRRGVAQALLQAVLDAAEARGVQTVNLRVEKDNAAAQACYRKAGFAVDDSHLVMAFGRTPAGAAVGQS